jgi:DNA-binding NtrC family response regulator
MASGLDIGDGFPLSGRTARGTRPRPAVRRIERLVGTSAAARRLEATIARAATVDSTVLIAGETGCGKEEIARAIHALGPRSASPFVAVNCGAMAASLIESQLFGHEKGSFTGAHGSSHGVFRAAEGGVVFLDEIGEMPLELQPRLLRVLQEREVTPLGSTETHHVDVQVIAATNRDILAEVAKGKFREDLYYRLNTIEIEVPPLRERGEDIPLFVSHFCRHFAAKFATDEWLPDAETQERFARYRWPGNVRQLAQAIERVYALGELPTLPEERAPALAPAPAPTAARTLPEDFGDEAPLPVLNLEQLRRIAVRQAMALTNGHKGQAAGLLGVHINTMTKLVEETLPALSQRRRPKPR